MQDQQVHLEETVREQNRQSQNSHQISAVEFFQEMFMEAKEGSRVKLGVQHEEGATTHPGSQCL